MTAKLVAAGKLRKRKIASGRRESGRATPIKTNDPVPAKSSETILSRQNPLDRHRQNRSPRQFRRHRDDLRHDDSRRRSLSGRRPSRKSLPRIDSFVAERRRSRIERRIADVA
jgi:hypothetical protein